MSRNIILFYKVHKNLILKKLKVNDFLFFLKKNIENQLKKNVQNCFLVKKLMKLIYNKLESQDQYMF